MSDRAVTPARQLQGAVRPPGDKSISHRAAMLAAIGDGSAKLANYSTGADCQSTLRCLEQLGVQVARGEEVIEIAGVGLRGLQAPGARLDAGNSGSTIRMLSGILAAQPFASEIGGDASLSRRPMARIKEPLTMMGANIKAALGAMPPLQFAAAAGGLRAIEYQLPVASAQVKSAILLAGLFASGTTRVLEPIATRDHTELMLQHLGAPLERHAGVIEIRGPVESLRALGEYVVPGDPSSAAFFLCAAAALPGSDVIVEEVLLNPTRAALLDVLARLGAQPQVMAVEERAGELVGTLQIRGPKSGLGGTNIAGAEAAALMDEVPILAVLATQTTAGIRFEDVAELRVKESDRIETVAANLRAMGARCEAGPSSLEVPGKQRLRGARVVTRGDHRIAMAFAVAGLWAEGETVIEDSECAAVSYPEFFADLDRLASR